MERKTKGKVKYTLLTIIIALLMAFVFGCQPIAQFGFLNEKKTDNNPSNWSQSQSGENGGEITAGNDYEVLAEDNFYAAEGLKATPGVSVPSGEYIKSYTVNNINVTFEEGSLGDGFLYDSLLVNGKIFGEKFYSDKVFSSSYYNGYAIEYKYDKGKIVEATYGEDKFEYQYDGSGRIEKIYKNVDKNFYNKEYFLYRQYIYSDYKFDKTNKKDPLTVFFLFEEQVLDNPFVAELRYPAKGGEPSGGRVYSFSKEGILLNYTNLSYDSVEEVFWPEGELENPQIEYGAPRDDEAEYIFGHEYSGNSYMTKRSIKVGDYTNTYSYEYINNKIVAESCFDGKKSQGYDITYIFDNSFNRMGFVYNNEKFYYVYDIFGNTEKIVDVNGNTVVKYRYDLYGRVEVVLDREDNIGLYNSYTYRGLYDWYYDNDLGFYYVDHDKIFDVESGSFIEGNIEPEVLKEFIKVPVNKTIRNGRIEEFKLSIKASLTKETIIKEKTTKMAAENLSYENFKSYSNILVWDHSSFYNSYNLVGGLAWEDIKAGEITSVGRADIYTAPGNSEARGDFGSDVYILGNSDDLSFAQNKLFNLTDINSYVCIDDGISTNRNYTYKGEIAFQGHFIYKDEYVTYKSVADGIIAYNTKPNKFSNYDRSLGNLYNFDVNSYVLYYGSADKTNYVEKTSATLGKLDWDKFDEDFMAKYDNGWGGCYVEAVNTTYYSEEAAAALKRNTGGKITFFGGYDLEELRAQMGDDFGFTSVNGKTTVVEAKKSKNEFDVGNFIGDMAVGVGIIVVASTVIAMTGGSATPFVCFLATSASLTAISLAGGAMAMGINMAMSMKKTGEVSWTNALNGFSDAFMVTAAVSSIAALTTGTGACFAAGTEVKTSKGAKAIENIQKGDLVLSYNELTKTTEYKTVEETFVRETFEKINIKTAKDDIITTPEHPFYSGGKWVQAKDLRAGDRLQDVNGKTVIVEQIQHELLETPLTVYNFKVNQNHNYYVADGILVHNANYETSAAMRLSSMNFSAASGLSLSKVLLFADIAAMTIIVGGSISIPEQSDVMRSITEAERKPRTKEWSLLDYTANGGEMNMDTRFYPAVEIDYKLIMDHSIYGNYLQALAYLRVLGVLETAGIYTSQVIQDEYMKDPWVLNEAADNLEKAKGKNPKRVHHGVYTECPSHAMELGIAAGCGPIRKGFAPAPANSVFYKDGDGFITAYLVATEKLPGYYHLRGPNDAFRIWCMYPAYMYMAHDGWDIRWLDPLRDPITGLKPDDSESYIYGREFIWSDDYIKYQEWLLREFEAEHLEWQWWSVY